MEEIGMPIRIDNDLPAKRILESENIFVMDENRAMHQDIRPLQILILNLMPLKEDTEVNLPRNLSNTPLQVDVSFIRTKTHQAKNTSLSHLERFYTTFDLIKNRKFDGMIITGAPVEHLEFEEVNYWDELVTIMEWSKKNVTSTLHLCWGAQAGLYYHYGIPKYKMKEKLFGIFKHETLDKSCSLVRGFDDTFMAPHSRHTQNLKKDILKCSELRIIAESKEAGPFIIMEENGKQIFVTGHPEYDRYTLDAEYKRDLEKGLEIAMPVNYYPQNNMEHAPELIWRCHSTMMYTNWLNYFVYQVTPYDLEESSSTGMWI